MSTFCYSAGVPWTCPHGMTDRHASRYYWVGAQDFQYHLKCELCVAEAWRLARLRMAQADSESDAVELNP